VLSWIEREGLDIVDEHFKQKDGWAYGQFLLHSPTRP
jgi:hypothetical protein